MYKIMSMRNKHVPFQLPLPRTKPLSRVSLSLPFGFSVTCLASGKYSMNSFTRAMEK